MPLEELFTKGEAAQALRVSRFTVDQWITRGKLHRVKAGGRTLVRKSELERFLRENGSTSQGRKKANREAVHDSPSALNFTPREDSK